MSGEGGVLLEPRPSPERPADPIRMLTLDGRPSLRLLHAEPEQGPARATMVILPGRAEFIEKYAETTADLLARRLAVAIVEWRGQGLSHREGPHIVRGHVADFAHYMEDLDRALGHLADASGRGPWLMLAHSMGGHLGLRALHDLPDRFGAALMTAPMFDIHLKGVPVHVARSLGWLALRLGGGLWYAPGQHDFVLERLRFEGNPLTGDPGRFEVFRRLLAERPDLRLGGVTYGWLAAALRSIALTRRPGYLEAIRTPVVVCQAGLERIVANAAQDRFVARLPEGRLVRFPGARHELLLESDPVRGRVLALLDGLLAELGLD